MPSWCSTAPRKKCSRISRLAVSTPSSRIPSPRTTGFLKTDAGKDFEFTGGDQHDEACHGPGAGMAVRKADTALRDDLNKAIKALRTNGTYQKINAKYFDFDIFGG